MADYNETGGLQPCERLWVCTVDRMGFDWIHPAQDKKEW